MCLCEINKTSQKARSEEGKGSANPTRSSLRSYSRASPEASARASDPAVRGAALRAAEINAQCVLKATMVDGVYDCDPKQNPGAVLYESLTYETVQRLGLGVMDLTAITLCQENDIPVVVFNLNKPGNITRALRGHKVGTCVSSDVQKFERMGSGDVSEIKGA